jgi:DNA repair protein RecO (recombination protein O)
MPTFSDQITVLRVYDLGEADRIAICLGKKTGKISCVAKGARKSGGKFSGKVQPLNTGDALLYTGKSLNTINQFEITETNLKIKANLLKQCIGIVIAEATDASLEKEAPSEETFFLLNQSLFCLSDAQFNSMILYSFLLQLLAITGFQPELTSCANCSNTITAQKIMLSTSSGGLICSDCCHLIHDLVSVDQDTIFQLKSMQQFDWHLEKSNADGFFVSNKAAEFIEKMYEQSWGKKLRSLEFLKKNFAS